MCIAAFCRQGYCKREDRGEGQTEILRVGLLKPGSMPPLLRFLQNRGRADYDHPITTYLHPRIFRRTYRLEEKGVTFCFSVSFLQVSFPSFFTFAWMSIAKPSGRFWSIVFRSCVVIKNESQLKGCEIR